MQFGEGLCPKSQSIEESQGRNLESGTEVEAVEECCLLAAQAYCYILHDYLSTSVIKEENAPHVYHSQS